MERLGYVKLYRKLLDSVIWDNEKALKIWIWCLLKANHKDKIVLLGRQRISIKSGEFVFGSLKAKNELKMAISTIWYYLNFFKTESQVEIKATNKYSIITILNWKSYQGIENKLESKKKAKLKTNRKQIGNKVETNKNDIKNDKNVKNNNTDGDFDKFYSAYPRKVAKPAAIRAFKKIKPNHELLNAILKDIEMRKKSREWLKSGGQFIPYPATYLNQRRWEDKEDKKINLKDEIYYGGK
jgi:hypothetical protein